MTTYYEGDPVPLTFALTNAAGELVDAVSTQPVVTVTLPDGTTATPSVSNPSTGEYTATYDTTEAGYHKVAWVCADATYPGADADVFQVWSTVSANVLSYLDAKATLGIPAGNLTWDDEIAEINASITEWLEWYCGKIVPATVVESLRSGGPIVQLSMPPVVELVAWTEVPAQFAADTSRVVPVPPSPMFPVMVYGLTYPLANLYADQEMGWVRHTSGLPFFYGPFLWQYTAGMTVIPDNILQGARTTLRHLFGIYRGGASAAVAAAGASADEETTETPFGFAVPNRVLELLAPSQLPAAIA